MIYILLFLVLLNTGILYKMACSNKRKRDSYKLVKHLSKNSHKIHPENVDQILRQANNIMEIR